jgi:hypothetical protein
VGHLQRGTRDRRQRREAAGASSQQPAVGSSSLDHLLRPVSHSLT